VATLEVEKKILLLGEPAVGKTSLVRRFVIDVFSDRYIITIGTKTSRKVMDFDFPEHSLHVKLQLYIWDVFGQQGMPRAYTIYFKGAEAAILAFDQTRPMTFAALDRWAATLNSICGNIPGVMACNKADLDRDASITDDDIAQKAAALHMVNVPTSAKTGENVEEAFQTVGSLLCAPMVGKYARGELYSQKPGGKQGASRWKPIT
jgi:small GTP-binding protein